MIAAVTNVLETDPITKGVSPVACSWGSMRASPLALDQMLPSGNAIEAPIAGAPVSATSRSRMPCSCGPSRAAVPVSGASVRGGVNVPRGVGWGVSVGGGSVGPVVQHGLGDSMGVPVGEVALLGVAVTPGVRRDVGVCSGGLPAGLLVGAGLVHATSKAATIVSSRD